MGRCNDNLRHLQVAENNGVQRERRSVLSQNFMIFMIKNAENKHILSHACWQCRVSNCAFFLYIGARSGTIKCFIVVIVYREEAVTLTYFTSALLSFAYRCLN